VIKAGLRNAMSNQPKVSVCMITYNHAGFIAAALDSALMQRTSFDYEIVVGEDCSTDRTREIIKDYQKHWPSRVKPLFRQENVGMQRNGKETLEACRGEYVAFLEGDDYWTDPNKLQLQVEYLDRHRDCAFVHHPVSHVHWPSKEFVGEFPPARYRVERPPPRELAMYNFVQTCSLLCRREWMPPLDAEFQELKLGDWPLCVLMSERGWVGFIDLNMAHYRVHAANTWNNRPADYKVRAMEKMAWYLLGKVSDDSKDAWRDTLLALACKNVGLALASLSPRRTLEALWAFGRLSVQFKKPFWLANRFWPYYEANYRVRSTLKPMAQMPR
jgi:glycosyltransferase involved in cell wall biosynthesis